jgi:hypothetical protein
MIIWILEYNGGSQYDHDTEIIGVFDSLENAKATYPTADWQPDKYGRDIWEWEFDKIYPRSLRIYTMELNKLYETDYFMGEIK